MTKMLGAEKGPDNAYLRSQGYQLCGCIGFNQILLIYALYHEQLAEHIGWSFDWFLFMPREFRTVDWFDIRLLGCIRA